MVAICHKLWKMLCEFKGNVECEDKTLCEYFYARKWKQAPNKPSCVLEHPSGWSIKGKKSKHFSL